MEDCFVQDGNFIMFCIDDEEEEYEILDNFVYQEEEYLILSPSNFDTEMVYIVSVFRENDEIEELDVDISEDVLQQVYTMFQERNIDKYDWKDM